MTQQKESRLIVFVTITFSSLAQAICQKAMLPDDFSRISLIIAPSTLPAVLKMSLITKLIQTFIIEKAE